MQNFIETLHEDIGNEILSKLNQIVSAAKKRPFLNIHEAAELTGYKVSTLYQLTFKHEIPCHKVGRLLRFKESELIDWIEQGRRQTIDEMGEEAIQEMIQARKSRKKGGAA